MATRQKTIRFKFDLSTGSVATATARDFTQRTIYIPETVVAFRSVMQVFHFQSAGVTTAWTSILMGIALAAVAREDTTVSGTITSSGEDQSARVINDVTSYFTTNWTGTSMTSDARLTISGPTTVNATCELIITYDYDDTAGTHIKTVRIPIGGANTALTQTLAAIGPSGAIPALDSYLPEASKTYRDIAFELEFNEQVASAGTDPILEVQLDSETATSLATQIDTSISSRFIHLVWRRMDMTTNATHTFNARSTQSAMGMTGLSIILSVTYEFSPGSTTRVLNEILLPVMGGHFHYGGADADNKSMWGHKFFIEEPGTISIKQSALLGHGNDYGPFTLNIACGDQNYRTYSWADNLMCGQRPFLHRLDSNGGLGTGIEISRGENAFTINAYRTGSTVGQCGNYPNGWLLLQYESDKSSSGVGAHNHTVLNLMQGYNALHLSQSPVQLTSKRVANIPETTFWVTGLGLNYEIFTRNNGIFPTPYGLDAKRAALEGMGSGWEPIVVLHHMVENGENATFDFRLDIRDKFKRSSLELDSSKLDIETARDWLVSHITSSGGYFEIWSVVTYHSISFSFSGSITGYAGDGSGIVVDIFRLDTMERVAETVSTSGGSYTATLFDDQLTYWAVARQDGTHVGRSDHASVG